MKVVALVAALTLVACSSGHATKRAGGTVPEERPTTSTTDPYAVPAVIDAAYVNRVLGALDHVYGDAIRALVAAKAVTPDFTDRMRAIYGDDQLGQITGLANHALQDGLAELSASPGDPKTTVSRLVTTDPRCVLAAVNRDVSALGPPHAGALPVPQQYVALAPLNHSRDARGYNPTPWLMAYEGFQSDGSQPKSPCGG